MADAGPAPADADYPGAPAEAAYRAWPPAEAADHAWRAADAAYQGVPGAFSEDAARALVGAGARLRPCATLDEVFAAVTGGAAAAGVVPIENTLAGPVPGCADLLARHDVRVVGECARPIVHALIAAPGVPMDAVRRVYSHPVAIAQCEAFLRAHPRMTPVAAFDTAGAVRDVVRERAADAAAIAHRRAAAEWGAVVLADGIQDSAGNFTRFLLVRPGAAPGPRRTDADPRQAGGGPWRTAVVCDLANEPGALARALASFARHGLNLSRIESRPIRETPFAYRFHLEIGPSPDAAPVAEALAELAACCGAMRLVGHYRTLGAQDPPNPDPPNPDPPNPGTLGAWEARHSS
ncbi:MAG: prephenate dehydratase domain-containing protein [Vicinamibacterales bacterium]